MWIAVVAVQFVAVGIALIAVLSFVAGICVGFRFKGWFEKCLLR